MQTSVILNYIITVVRKNKPLRRKFLLFKNQPQKPIFRNEDILVIRYDKYCNWF